MTLDDFITTVFCTVDDFLIDLLGEGRLRQRGPRPTAGDSVVVTCELVGEFTCVNLRFLRYDTDSGIFTYFRRHHADLFPELQDVHRTTFGRQAANLWKIKEHLHGYLQGQVSGDRLVTLTDSFQRRNFCAPVCRCARLPAPRR